MTSFNELTLGPETVAALAAQGMETPTPFQVAAVPVIARGNDLLGRAGPGSGTLVAYGAPLLDRLEGGAGSPVCLVLCTGQRQATELARSFAPICQGSGHRVAALVKNWNAPVKADFLFVPADRIQALYDGSVSVNGVKAVVFHDGDGVVSTVSRDLLETFLSGLPGTCQRVFCGLPFGSKLRFLARRFTRRAATVPSGSMRGEEGPSRSGRGSMPGRRETPTRDAAHRSLSLVVMEGSRQESVLALVAEVLRGSAAHVLVFAASADQAADLGDFVGLHGYVCGPPGDPSAPVWLSSGEDEAARKVLEALPDPAVVATLSGSVPPDAEAAETRHGTGGPAWVLAAVRELGHLKTIASGAGFGLRRIRPTRPLRVSSGIDGLADRMGELVRLPEAAPYYLLVESLLDRFTAAEVAAAALLLLDREKSAKKVSVRPGQAAPPPSWVRLFVSVGKRDEVSTGKLLGTLTGESGVPGNRVGQIDIRENHSLVEVREGDARKVIAALNGITLGGRAVRADYDRGRDRQGVAKKDKWSGGPRTSAGKAKRDAGYPPKGRGTRRPR